MRRGYEVVFNFRDPSDTDTAVTSIKAVNLQGVFVEQMTDPFMQGNQYTSVEATAPAHQPSRSIAGLNADNNAVCAIPIYGWITCYRRAADSKAKADDRQKIGAEYQKRQIQYFKLASGGSLVGSAFFPALSSGVQEVVFTTKQNGKTGELRVKLNRAGSAKASQ